MGHLFTGSADEPALRLRDQYGLKVLIETGTYKAESSMWAAQHFETVITVEGDSDRYMKTVSGLRNPPANLTFTLGDSRTVLANLLADVDAPCLLWLDAHWCGGGAVEAYTLKDECPLREEIHAILNSKYAEQHVLMIDDARLFTAPPPYPHHAEQWPSYEEIAVLLAPRRVYIDGDVIYAEPH